MGEIADATINGFFCNLCGQFIDGEEPGFPRTCKDCKDEERKESYVNKARLAQGKEVPKLRNTKGNLHSN